MFLYMYFLKGSGYIREGKQNFHVEEGFSGQSVFPTATGEADEI